MGDSDSKGDNLPAAIFKSPAGEKLADAIKNIVDYTVGPNRIRSVAQARADAAVIAAKSEAEVDIVRAQAAERLLDREIRNQHNIDAITGEAFKALPPPGTKVTEEPVSEDFVYRFFEECEGIGNVEMQKLWGKLLAGEVVRPGSFHPRTLRILKDLTTQEARLLTVLNRCSWYIGEVGPLVFEPQDEVYKSIGLSFAALKHMDSLGLLSFDNLGGFVRIIGAESMLVIYGKQVFSLSRPAGGSGGLGKIPVGKVLLSEAGKQLSTLCAFEPVDGMVEYITERWKNSGHVLGPFQIPGDTSVPSASAPSHSDARQA
jgi:hypothetical protein